jgi:AhpD family alkylhydroperoxidase
MQARLNPYKLVPGAYKAMTALQAQADEGGLEPAMMELVKTRASQINGCAFCLTMHTQDARKHGESEDRLHLLSAWRETSLYSDRERAALAWTEAVTLVASSHVPDDVFEEARKYFSETELVNLTMQIVAINSWNRLAISFRAQPQVAAKAAE